jgi:hypothetical protein
LADVTVFSSHGVAEVHLDVFAVHHIDGEVLEELDESSYSYAGFEDGGADGHTVGCDHFDYDFVDITFVELFFEEFLNQGFVFLYSHIDYRFLGFGVIENPGGFNGAGINA